MSRYTGKMLEAQIEEWNKELEEMGCTKRLAPYYEYGHTYLVWQPVGETCHNSINGDTPRLCLEAGYRWMEWRRIEKAKGEF